MITVINTKNNNLYFDDLQRKLENVVFVCIVVICLCTKQIIMSDTMGGWNNINTIII